jgi:hypothetical protein
MLTCAYAGYHNKRLDAKMTARPRFQRAFLAWLKLRGPSLAVGCGIVGIRRTHIVCRLAGLPQNVRTFLNATGLAVQVDYRDKCWDFIFDIDAFPVRVAGGYACSCCDPSTRPVYSSREALWCGEVFEPFYEWIALKLALARSIGLYQTAGGGCTFALLGNGSLPTPVTTEGLVASFAMNPVPPRLSEAMGCWRRSRSDPGGRT